MTPHLFAQTINGYGSPTTSTPAANATSAVTLLMLTLIITVVLVVIIVSLWKVYRKAGRPGWAAIIPIYSQWVLAEIAGKPGWWAFLQFIPIVNIIISLIIALGVAQKFGKSPLFGVLGLWLFSIIGYPILGFGSATYQGNGPTVNGPQLPPATMGSSTPQSPQVSG